MKLIDTKIKENSQIEDDNNRKCLLEINCHQIRMIVDGLIEIIGPLDRMENKDEDDVMRLEEARTLRTEFKESYRRTKNLMGVHAVE